MSCNPPLRIEIFLGEALLEIVRARAEAAREKGERLAHDRPFASLAQDWPDGSAMHGNGAVRVSHHTQPLAEGERRPGVSQLGVPFPALNLRPDRAAPLVDRIKNGEPKPAGSLAHGEVNARREVWIDGITGQPVTLAELMDRL